MAHQDTLTLTCPAKVNLALSVGPPDEKGMHPLASWMIAVTFGDVLTLTRRETDSTPAAAFDITWRADAPQPTAIDWPLPSDLAYRAHQLLQQQVGRPLPVDIALAKRIPTGAGLGGGSSDAAAMLVGLDRLFALNLGMAALMEAASQLGSDVGFLVHALSGHHSAIVTGLGEQVEAAPLPQVIHLVLIFPQLGCPTGAVYRALDEQRAGIDIAHLPDLPRVRALTTLQPLPQDGPFNDLAAPACAVEPQLRQTQQRVREAVNLPVHITGSGAALFIIAPSAITAKVIARKVTALTTLPAVATRTG